MLDTENWVRKVMERKDSLELILGLDEALNGSLIRELESVTGKNILRGIG